MDWQGNSYRQSLLQPFVIKRPLELPGNRGAHKLASESVGTGARLNACPATFRPAQYEFVPLPFPAYVDALFVGIERTIFRGVGRQFVKNEGHAIRRMIAAGDRRSPYGKTRC